MSAFVRKQPQAKHYFELATTDLKFIFPNPGRLEGIRTSTQRFLEMEGVNYRYPGNDGDTLTDVHLKMTLSSRVCLIGANGAGKCPLLDLSSHNLCMLTSYALCLIYLQRQVKLHW